MVLNRDPEYLRRVREKAEKNKQEAQAKERESAHERDIVCLIAAAIHAVKEELKRGNDEQTPEKKSDRRWQHGLPFAVNFRRSKRLCPLGSSNLIHALGHIGKQLIAVCLEQLRH